MQHHDGGAVRLEVTAVAHGWDVGFADTVLRINGRELSQTTRILPGENRIAFMTTIDEPRLWWPMGQGTQEFYELKLVVDRQPFNCQIGLRDIRLITEPMK